MLMDALSHIPDNLSEVLVKIIHFTELRRRVLHRNIHKVDSPAFTPQDLPVREFADLLNEAVAEHLRSHRLVFRDTASIQFGPNNTMQIWPETDAYAHALLRTSRDQYMELEVNKLLENSLNRKVAEELLREKCGTCPSMAGWFVSEPVIENESSGNLPTHHDATE
jgi:flagellar basal body rod protein FlgB